MIPTSHGSLLLISLRLYIQNYLRGRALDLPLFSLLAILVLAICIYTFAPIYHNLHLIETTYFTNSIYSDRCKR